MKKLFKVLVILSLIIRLNVYADNCSNKDLLNEANKVKVSHEVVTEKVKYGEDSGLLDYDPDPNETYDVDTFYITIYNITENMLISVSNDLDDEIFSIGYSDTDSGKYTFTSTNVGDIVKYKFEISSVDDKCYMDVLKTIRYTKPKYNMNYGLLYCQENPDDRYCQKFISTDSSMTGEKMQKYIEQKNKTVITTKKSNDDEKDSIFTSLNIKYIIIGVIVIGVGVTAGVIINKKRSAL